MQTDQREKHISGDKISPSFKVLYTIKIFMKIVDNVDLFEQNLGNSHRFMFLLFTACNILEYILEPFTPESDY